MAIFIALATNLTVAQSKIEGSWVIKEIIIKDAHADAPSGQSKENCLFSEFFSSNTAFNFNDDSKRFLVSDGVKRTTLPAAKLENIPANAKTLEYWLELLPEGLFRVNFKDLSNENRLSYTEFTIQTKPDGTIELFRQDPIVSESYIFVKI